MKLEDENSFKKEDWKIIEEFFDTISECEIENDKEYDKRIKIDLKLRLYLKKQMNEARKKLLEDYLAE